MKTLVAGFSLLCLLTTAHAITWNFDRDPQGWAATEAEGTGTHPKLPLLQGTVDQGIWTVPLLPYQQGRSPGITLYSPFIDHNSRLFDECTIRLRLVHSRPVVSSLILSWTIAANDLYPGNDPDFLGGGCPPNPYCHPRFWLVADPTHYSTGWQELTVSDLRSRVATWPGGEEYEILWEDRLRDIRLTLPFVVEEDPEDPQGAQRPDQVPVAVEIDWIRLTGPREQAQGELPPPTPPVAAGGPLFAPAVFQQLGQVEQLSGWDWEEEAGALGDLDGDGDADLVTRWQRGQEGGWLLGYNDGRGFFARVQTESFAAAGFAIKDSFVGGADLDGDGRLDLVLDSPVDQLPPQVWLNDAQGGWARQSLPSFFAPAQLTDLDGDGRPDLWGYRRGTLDAQLLFNDGAGHFSSPQQPPSAGGGYYVWTAAFPSLPSRQQPLVWRPAYEQRLQGLISTYTLASGARVQEPLRHSQGLEPERLIGAGDLDLDGPLELILNDEGALFAQGPEGRPALGLKILRQEASGAIDTTFALPDLYYHRRPLVVDLNADGLLDLVLVHDELRQPAVVVLTGRGEGRFEVEGRYPLSPGRGGAVLAADLDGEGHPDLVVFDSFVSEGAGIHVLLNRLGQGTAVEEEGPPRPTRTHLDPAYPNPFNPGVVIPFTLSAPAQRVTLRLYDLLGQEVATLDLGALPAGAHHPLWDGRDLAAGVYLYRLQADAWSATGKLTKID
ncbi:MAG: VCBS repeat-containing protein [Candidatus Latescibacteria bacterium]|nr:VCBS repeat-containing protein [Candidatus Latescibacterota bacterium]